MPIVVLTIVVCTDKLDLVPGRLLAEIAQSKPFPSLELEAHLNLLRTTDIVQQNVAAILRPHGISQTQYNVLRILRGAGPDGLKCSDVGNRLITRDPDITRLLDRMEREKLVERARQDTDRRVVKVRITEEGHAVLARLDEPMHQVSVKTFAHLGAERLQVLIELLEQVRCGNPGRSA